MTDVPGAEGFQVASAFVQVDPDASTFEESLDAQIGEINYVVQIPVVPDAGDFAGEVEAAVGGTDLAVQVPVVPDTTDFGAMLDSAVEAAKATVTVPVEADTAGLDAQVEAAGTEAGEAAGASFGEKFSSVASGTALFTPDASEIDAGASAAGTEAGTTFGERLTAAAEASGLTAMWPEVGAGASAAGEAAGTAFGEDFAVAAEPRLSALLGASSAGLVTEAGTAGEEAGTVFLKGFTSATAGLKTPLAELAPAADAESAVAGEDAGVTFSSRFTAALAGLKASLAETFAGAGAEGEAGGLAAGEGFASKLKGVISGAISPMEALMGAGFVAVAADMASKFQSAMEMIHTQAGVAQSAISGLSGGVLSLAGQVGSSPDSLAEALYHIESSFQSVGITGSSALNLLKVAAEGAAAGHANLVDVTNALDATIASGVGGVHSYSQAMGALNAIVGAGDMTMQDLANAMGSGLMANAKLYGQSIQQVGAALATLGDNNIRGAKAATDLRMAWQAMQAPLTTAKPLLESIGLTYTQLGQTMEHQGMSVAIQQFVDHLKASKIPVADWGQYVTEIFGKKAGAGIGVLIDQMGRLNSKFPDIQKGADDFGKAWASTEATTKQKVKDLESGFDALMIKIGNGLLPAVDGFMSMITRNLPAIEKFGTDIAHLVAPFVTAFFTGLEAILKVLLGPLRDLTLGVAAFAAGWMALNFIMDLNPFVAIGTAIIVLVGLVIKYHKQILDAIEEAWNAVYSFVSGIAAQLVSLFENWTMPGLIIKYHQEIWATVQQVWQEIVSFIETIVGGASLWLSTAWNAIWNTIKTVWTQISTWFTTWWTTLVTAWEKTITTLETWFKTAWNQIWTDIKTVWNQISSWFTSWWQTEVNGWENIVNTVLGWLKTAWSTVKSDAVAGFNAVRSAIATIWDGIVSDVENFIKTIESKIAGIGSSITALPGKILSSIGLAGGGVIPGYAPGHDSVNAKLSPGEAVLVPEAVRAIGPGTINAINARYSSGRRGYSDGGVVPSLLPGFSAGGVAGNLTPYQAGQAAGQMYSSYDRTIGSGQGATIVLNFNGTSWPTPEQQQAMMMQLGALVGVS